MPEMLFDTQDLVPEDVRADAVAKDGKFAVNLVSAKKLDEFRNNNVNLSKERDSLSSVIGRLKTDAGFDPEAIDDFITNLGELRTTKQLVDDGKLIKDTSLDEALGKKTAEMQRQHQTQVGALETANRNFQQQVTDLQSKLDNTILDQRISEAVGNQNSGVRPDALRAVIREAKEFFQVKDGKLVPYDHDNQIIYGADGTSPMTPLEWIKTRLSETSPYLFQESSGGGAGGGGTGGLSQAALAALSPAERMRAAREAGAR